MSYYKTKVPANECPDETCSNCNEVSEYRQGDVDFEDVWLD